MILEVNGTWKFNLRGMARFILINQLMGCLELIEWESFQRWQYLLLVPTLALGLRTSRSNRKDM